MPHYVIDINHSDDLYNIVRKCNTNFRAISAQVERQGQVDGTDIQEEIDAIFEAIDELGDYENLENKPSIEGTVLVGDKTLPEINSNSITNEAIDDIIFSGPGPTPPSPVIIIVSDYNQLSNKPSIENTVLSGNKTLAQIGIGDITPQEIDDILFG